MELQFIYLAIITLISLLCPYVASLIPGRPIPEVVFLVFAGAILGQNGLGLFDTEFTSIEMLSELGLAFLFLMAGYEIDPKKLTGKMGKHACITWAVSLGIALVITPLLPLDELGGVGSLAFAIALTTTAYGTLAPILRDRNLTGTPVGEAVTVYGATGELLPVLAMAFMLSSRSTWLTAVILGIFALVCLYVAKLPDTARMKGSRVLTFLDEYSESGSQARVRLTVALLVFLVALSAALELDIVLGAFAAGFILRHADPNGNKALESKLEGIGNGFLIPLFFIVSGSTIDLSAATSNPALLLGFMALLLIVRAIPVGVSLRISPETSSLTRPERVSCALYCSMALPLIVAVTNVAVNSEAMTAEMGSILVTAGACTVLVVPLATSLVRRISAAHPVTAVEEIAHDPAHLGEIVREHSQKAALANERFRKLRDEHAEHGERFSSTDYLAIPEQPTDQNEGTPEK